jgi:tryptophan 2,3-dioxygenase
MEHHELNDRIKQLKDKFNTMGQPIDAYLEGLMYADYLTYWDYIHLDTLLTLQKPRTHFKDEQIFIMYHQITELYFKLILLEIDQILEDELEYAWTINRFNRIIDYVKHLVSSFNVMVNGMDKEQFLKFRMALLPASGFQSAQIRLIELKSTPLRNLCHDCENCKTLDDVYDNIYWKKGATELSTKKKTLTLKQFEEKYDDVFINTAKKHENNNLWTVFERFKKSESTENVENLKSKLREYDELMNVHWCLMHYKSAVRYLQKDPVDIAATGGTNWQKYLPPMYQKITYFPQLWTKEELSDWGKKWVYKEIFDKEV